MDEFSSAPATHLTSAAIVAPAASLGNSQAPPELPQTPRRHDITRDQRLHVHNYIMDIVLFRQFSIFFPIAIPDCLAHALFTLLL